MSKKQFFLFVGLLGTAAFCAAADEPKVKLPPPYATPSVNNGPHVVDKPAGAQLHVPDGFHVDEFASGFDRPRYMLLGPSKEILLSDSGGTVYVLTNYGKDRRKLIDGLDRPYGLAFWKDYLYVGEPTSIKRYKYDSKTMTAGKGEEVVSLKGDGRGHWTRSLLFDRKGEKLYVGVGSASNVSPGEPPERAAINRYNPDGSGHEIFASGTRNPIGLHWYPGTGTLWAAVQERDLLGDNLVPDYFTHIQQGGFYGWPYAYIGPHVDPRNEGDEAGSRGQNHRARCPARLPCRRSRLHLLHRKPVPRRNIAAAPSWPSTDPGTAPSASVTRSCSCRSKTANPAGEPQDFLTGWMLDPDSREVWGRPVAVLQLPDGSLLVTDDGGKKIWRIYYKG